MRPGVATNFDPSLIEAIREYPAVAPFGKLREGAGGGGRAPCRLAPVTRAGRREIEGIAGGASRRCLTKVPPG